MAVDQFNVKGIRSFKRKMMRQLARTVTDYGPFQASFERMQAIAGNIQRLRRSGSIENRGDSFHRVPQVRAYPTAVAAFIEPFEATMSEAPDHQDTP
jgi:hypothetical protein